MLKSPIEVEELQETSCKNNKLNILIPIVSFFMLIFIPTSNNTEIYGEGWMVFVWSIISLLILTLHIKNNTSYVKTIISLFLVMIYMFSITFAAINSDLNGRISIARIAPVALLIIMNTIKIKTGNQYNVMKRLIDIFFIVMIIWNVLILTQNDIVQSFTKDNYSQYYDMALYYSMLRTKPVMSFGVHTYASYFYILFFYMSFVTAETTNKYRYYIYCIFTVIITFFLTSTTSFIYGIVMVFMLLKLLRKKPLFICIIILLGSIVLYKNSDYLIETYTYMITESELNGIGIRYAGEGNIFSDNFKIIKENYAIGFTILDSFELDYSDSGYLVYLTMGNIPLVFYIYYTTYKFLKNNIPQENFIFISLVIFSFEFALSATFNYRYFYAVIFVVYYLNSLDLEFNKKTTL